MISTDSVIINNYELPEGTSILESQVAGHPLDVNRNISTFNCIYI